jgi:DNA-binding transcriptional regulator YiaG
MGNEMTTIRITKSLYNNIKNLSSIEKQSMQKFLETLIKEKEDMLFIKQMNEGYESMTNDEIDEIRQDEETMNIISNELLDDEVY